MSSNDSNKTLTGVLAGVLLASAGYGVLSTIQKYRKRTVKGRVKLQYFDIVGVAEKVRLALSISGIKFEDERIQFSEWKKIKSMIDSTILYISVHFLAYFEN